VSGIPAIQAMEAGYEVYAVVDASGGTSQIAHDTAIQRIVQAGAVPVTWQQVLLEYQRDWARKETYDAVTELVKEHSGAYGVGLSTLTRWCMVRLPATRKRPYWLMQLTISSRY